MAVTRLKRKARRNKLTAKKRLQKMSIEGVKPVIKNVDVDELKKQFKEAPAPTKEKKAVKEEKKAEAVVETTEKPVKEKAEKKAPAKKAAPKKTAASASAKATDDTQNAEKKETPTDKKAPAKKKPAAKKEDKKEE